MPLYGSAFGNFLYSALEKGSYPNGQWISKSGLIGRLYCPRINSQSYQQGYRKIFDDYHDLKPRKAGNADNRCRFLNAMKKCKYVEVLKKSTSSVKYFKFRPELFSASQNGVPSASDLSDASDLEPFGNFDLSPHAMDVQESSEFSTEQAPATVSNQNSYSVPSNGEEMEDAYSILQFLSGLTNELNSPNDVNAPSAEISNCVNHSFTSISAETSQNLNSEESQCALPPENEACLVPPEYDPTEDLLNSMPYSDDDFDPEEFQDLSAAFENRNQPDSESLQNLSGLSLNNYHQDIATGSSETGLEVSFVTPLSAADAAPFVPCAVSPTQYYLVALVSRNT